MLRTIKQQIGLFHIYRYPFLFINYLRQTCTNVLVPSYHQQQKFSYTQELLLSLLNLSLQYPQIIRLYTDSNSFK